MSVSSCAGLFVSQRYEDYIVQGHRFDIIEEFGCRPSVYVSIPAIFLMWVPSLIMSFVALIFAGKRCRIS